MGIVLGGLVLGVLALRVTGFWPQTPRTPFPGSPPVIILDPEWGSPGTLVTVTGSGWRPSERVTLRLKPPGELPTAPLNVGSVVVQFDGTFQTGFGVPLVSPWSEYAEVRVEAEGDASRTAATVIFDLRLRSGTDPVPGASTPTPTPTPTSEPYTPTPEPAASATPVVPTPTEPPAPPPPTESWRGEYFNSPMLSGNPTLVREDPVIDFDWGRGSPSPEILKDGFSARWTRTVSLEAGSYRFYATSDDGVRMFLDGDLIIDQWHLGRATTYTADRTLSAGNYTLVVEYFEGWGDASIRVWWDRPGDFPEWRGEYFDNVELRGMPVLTRNDPTLNFNWGSGSPAAGVPADRFSVRWTRTLDFEGGVYRFRALVDDGVRVYVGGTRVIDEWTNGRPREVTGDIALAAGSHIVKVEYYEAAGDAVMQLTWELRDAYPDWRGEYWNNRTLSGLPVVVRNDKTLDFDWGAGAPAPELPADGFSARWTRTVAFEAGTYRFNVLVDDGARLWVNDRLVIDKWQDGDAREVTADLLLTAGAHTLRLEMYENTGQARIRLHWQMVPTSFSEWKGEYWSNESLAGAPTVVRNDREIDFDWDRGAPAPGMPVDNFSARWTRTVNLPAGNYRFSARADDGVRILVDGRLVLDEWRTSSGETVHVRELPLAEGEHTFVVEYFEGGGRAMVKVGYERLPDVPTATPTVEPTVPPTLTPTPDPTETPIPDPTETPIPDPTETPMTTPTGEPVEAPPETPTPDPTVEVTETPTPTAVPETAMPLPTQTPTATATVPPVGSSVRMNEIMPLPGEVDWNRDGAVDAGDAWIELHNPTRRAVDISLWVLEVISPDDTVEEEAVRISYQFPKGTVVGAGAYLVLYSGESGLAPRGGILRLLEGELLRDEVGAAQAAILSELAPDQVLSRDLLGAWQQGWRPTPGTVNIPPVVTKPAVELDGWFQRLIRRLGRGR
jgi:hypothetical protein